MEQLLRIIGIAAFRLRHTSKRRSGRWCWSGGAHRSHVSAKRLVWPIALTLLIAHTFGCGSGFTNDSIPDGRSVIKGRVVLASNPTISVPNATVTITTTPPHLGTLQYIVVSGADGGFEVNGIEVGPTNSNVTVTVAPNDPTIQQQRFSFLLTNQQNTYVVAALPPASLNLATVANVTLTTVAGAPPNSVKLNAQAVDANGQSLGIVPDMIFDNGVATIDADGSFLVNGTSPTADVLADVTATIYTGNAAPPTTRLQVTVGPPTMHTTGQTAGQ
jgi:hypothetical protein